MTQTLASGPLAPVTTPPNWELAQLFDLGDIVGVDGYYLVRGASPINQHESGGYDYYQNR